MIEGRIVESRPYIRAEVVVPLARGETRAAVVDFHVDTGSDITLLGRGVFQGDQALSDADTIAGIPSTGITGTAPSRVVPGYLVFDHVDGLRSIVSLWFTLVGDAQSMDISLLGLDVLLTGELTLNRDAVRFDIG